MLFLRSYCKIKASSLLESVIALTIISICLYFAVLIFSMVFTARNSSKFYETQNKINELFFVSQLGKNSLDEYLSNDSLVIEEEIIGSRLKKISVSYKDSLRLKVKKSFYIETNE